MTRDGLMFCWGGCGKRRPYPDEFPAKYWAVCWWCTPREVRLRVPEYQVPRRLRWWRTFDYRGPLPVSGFPEQGDDEDVE